MDEELEAAKEGSWRAVAVVNAAHARGELDDAGWHREIPAALPSLTRLAGVL